MLCRLYTLRQWIICIICCKITLSDLLVKQYLPTTLNLWRRLSYDWELLELVIFSLKIICCNVFVLFSYTSTIMVARQPLNDLYHIYKHLHVCLPVDCRCMCLLDEIKILRSFISHFLFKLVAIWRTNVQFSYALPKTLSILLEAF